MTTQELIDYVRDEFSKGVDASMISSVLIDKGWSQFDVDNALNQAGTKTEDAIEPEIPKENKPQVIVDNKAGKKRPIIKWLVLVPFVLIIAGVAYYGYFEIYLAPEKVFARSMNKMQSITSLAYEGTVSMRVKGDLFGSSGLESFFNLSSLFYSVDFSGGVEFGDRQNTKNNTLLDIKSRGESIAKVEIRNIKEDLYVFIHELIDISSFGFFDTSLLTGKWVEIDIDEYIHLLSEVNENVDTSVSDEQVEKYKNIFVNNNPIENLEKLGSEEINGIPAYHYKLSINKDAVKEIMTGIYEDYSGEEFTETEKRNLDERFEDLEFYGGEIWIGKKDGYVRKYKININTKDDNASDTTVTLSYDVTFDEFDQSFAIEEPKSSVTVEELFEEITKSLEIPVEPMLIETPGELPEGFDYKMFELDEGATSENESGFDYPVNVLTRLQELRSNVAGYATELSD
jgi:hypothetical protein